MAHISVSWKPGAFKSYQSVSHPTKFPPSYFFSKVRLRLVFIGDVSGIGIDECRHASLHLNLPVAYFSRSVIKFFICDAS